MNRTMSKAFHVAYRVLAKKAASWRKHGTYPVDVIEGVELISALMDRLEQGDTQMFLDSIKALAENTDVE